jgi:hypothetical protein
MPQAESAGESFDLKKLDDPELVRRINKGTYYGLYGNDNMVCSEADRWVLA